MLKEVCCAPVQTRMRGPSYGLFPAWDKQAPRVILSGPIST